MKSRKSTAIGLLTLALILAAGGLNPAPAADTYKLDPAHTSIVFRVKHLGVAYVYGRFNGPNGTFVFDKNVDTAVDKRDNHLKSPDFFNAAEHPMVKFESTSVTKSGPDSYEVSGNLTLLGKTRAITVNVRQTGGVKDPWGNYRRGFETSFTAKRSEYGMNFMMGGVSDEVMLIVSVVGVRQ